MIPQGRYIVLGFVLLVAAYVGRRSYLYYFDTTVPQVAICGFEENCGYQGDVAGSIKGSSPYKISHISMWLDDAAMHTDFKIGRKNFDQPILIPAKSIADGAHHVKFQVVDATKNKNSVFIERTFYTDNLPLSAALVPLASNYKVQQGRCMYVQVQVNKPVKSIVAHVLQNDYAFVPESKNSLIYETFVPIECEQDAGQYPFSVDVVDRLGNKMTLEATMEVQAVAFKRRVLNITGNKLQTELEFTEFKEQDLEQEMEKLARQSPLLKMWSGVFDIPLAMKGITTDFGVIRTSQERGRKVHKALDLVADKNSIVWASNNGVIVMKDRFTHTGHTVVVDHGCGVLSLYCHLRDYCDIRVGQHVKKGHPLGYMGMTGYASGDHLHWEIRVKNIAVDPMQWTHRWN